ncbi:hypothetical protein OMCYN_01142 [cyanobiont of Ornithocercus magnificus]|nr:hypothetical protein OMCYN_01142 [cyanobiont of Ornithocercus magnificus]
MRRCLAALILPVLTLCLALLQPDPAQAARGGRIGGSSFRAPSPSSPSIQRSSGTGYSGYRGGGIGFPFLIPIFGFGGGGLFGFLILMAAVGVLLNAMRSGGETSSLNNDREYNLGNRPEQPITITQLQVGLLSSARNLQEDLRRLASVANTSNTSGLQSVLQETTLALLRQPDLWVYGNAEIGSVPFASAESTFNQIAMTERSKLLSEVTINVAGHSSQSTQHSGEADATSEYIVVTVLLAARSPLRFGKKDALSSESLREVLQLLGSVPASELVALEVIWQPDGRGDVLSAEELVTAYPQLQHL